LMNPALVFVLLPDGSASDRKPAVESWLIKVAWLLMTLL